MSQEADTPPSDAATTRSPVENHTIPTTTPVEGRTALPRRRTVWPGVLSVVLAASGIIVEGVAIAVAVDGGFLVAGVLARTAVVFTAIAFLSGVGAIIARRGLLLGVVGGVLGLVTNPLVLVPLLGFFGDL